MTSRGQLVVRFIGDTRDLERATGRATSSLSKMRGPALAVGAGVAGLIASSVNLEKSFSQTMNVTAAVTNAPVKKMKELQDLALQLGKDTAFSAGEAATAMQELAKGGLSAATIQGGALKGTLELAAAGGVELATAAGIASNALNTFGLKGSDMAKVSAALAGGANASTASVESLGVALGQVGPGARNAGLDINETVGALAAFDSAGIKGSDAGTSLKTMLSRLVPQTAKAAGTMKKLGLDFTDAQGQFLPLTEIAQQLQDKLGGLSQEQRTTAMATIFGSDATRAATVLMGEGEKGLGKYIKATKDQGAAQRAADARMKGTAGSLERLSGSWETLRLKIGLAVAPAVAIVADNLGGLTNFLTDNTTAVMIAVGVVAGFAAVVLGLNAAITVAAAVGRAWAVVQGSVAVVTNLATGAKTRMIAAWAAEKAIMIAHRAVMIGSVAAQWALNAAMTANPIGLVIAAVVALVAGLVWFFTKTKIGQKIVKAAWGGIKAAIKGVADWWTSSAMPAIRKAIEILGKVFRFYAAVVKFVWVTVVWGTLKRVWGWIKKNVIDKFVLGLKVWAAIFRLLSGKAAGYFAGLRDRLGRIGAWIRENVFGRMRSALGTMRDAFRTARDKIGDIWNGLKKLAAKPINFVLGTVYNKGIRAWVGKIFKFFGKSNPLPEATMVQFAKGSEDHRAQIARAGAMRLWAEPETGGEAYIPLANSKRQRSTSILANVASRFGYGLQKYANGGFSFGLSDALKFAGDTGGWIKDKMTGLVSDKFGASRKGGIWDMLREIPGTIIKNMGGWAKDKLGSLFGGMFGGGGGGNAAAGMGWKAMWDAVKGAFPTANLNSAYRPGAVTAVGTPSYHGMGRAIDVSPSMKIFDWIAKTFPFSTELIYSPAGGRQLYKGRKTLFGEPTRGDHWDHVHWAMKNGGLFNKVPTFDNGGVLGTGLNLVNNATGRPESVSPDGGRPIHVHLHMDGKVVAEAIIDPLRGIVKTRGHGSVQATFGRGRG